MASYKIFSSLSELLKKAIKDGVFPGASVGISYKENRYIIQVGYKALCPFLEPLEEGDIFDLASLTKPLALTFSYMDFLNKNSNALDLFSPLKKYLDLKAPLSEIQVYRFFNHTSGLKAWYPFYQEILKNKIQNKLKYIVKRIEEIPLEYKTGEKSLYSDLGYFLLTHLLENLCNNSLEKIFERAKKQVSFGKKSFLDFKPLEKGINQENIVPTSVCPWKHKILRGVVEDENTRVIGGVSGTAGLFGNIYGVLDMLEFLLKTYKGEKKGFSQEIIREFLDFREKGSEFSLGFKVFSKKIIGHLGFTGCSFFIDLEKELIVVLLTNRVHPDRNNFKIREFRADFLKHLTQFFAS